MSRPKEEQWCAECGSKTRQLIVQDDTEICVDCKKVLEVYAAISRLGDLLIQVEAFQSFWSAFSRSEASALADVFETAGYPVTAEHILTECRKDDPEIWEEYDAEQAKEES